MLLPHSCFSLSPKYCLYFVFHCRVKPLRILTMMFYYRFHALFYNPIIGVYSYENLPFFAVGFTLSTIFVLLPTIFLCCYQFTRKIPIRWCCGMQHVIIIFMDAFQGYYKDGTNGTYNLRFLAGLYLILRIIIVLLISTSCWLEMQAQVKCIIASLSQ